MRGVTLARTFLVKVVVEFVVFSWRWGWGSGWWGVEGAFIAKMSSCLTYLRLLKGSQLLFFNAGLLGDLIYLNS